MSAEIFSPKPLPLYLIGLVAAVILSVAPAAELLVLFTRAIADGDVPSGALAEPTLAALKVEHAKAVPRYDIGLFGNSRVVAVGGEHMNLGPGRSVFNFAVPGTSLRQSTDLIEELVENDKAPQTAVIIFDNARLHNYEHSFYPGLFDRAGTMIGDVRLALRHGNFKLAVYALADWTVWESQRFAATFNALRVWATLRLAVGLDASCTSTAQSGSAAECYRPDGSRPELLLLAPGAPRAVESSPFLLASLYLTHDLARLADTGVQIIVVESPLSADVRFGSNSGAASAESVRAVLRDNCAKYRFHCVPAPDLGRIDRSPYWADYSHAPPQTFGPFLGHLTIQ